MNFAQASLASFALLALAACGGGGDAASGTDTAPSGVISGIVTKGSISDATVAAYGISGGQPGAQIATARTDASGRFSLAVGS